MKKLIQMTMAAGVFCSAAFAAEPPPELVKLKKQYNAAFSKKTASLYRKLDAELNSLQSSYLKSGKTASAQKVAELRKSGFPEEGVEELPERARELITRFDSIRSSTLRPLQTTYERELNKLKIKYGQAANLDAVVAIEKELSKVTPKKVKPEGKEFKVESLVGEWKVYQDGKLKDGTRRFNESQMIAEQGSRLPWKFVDDRTAVFITFGDGGAYFEKLQIDTSNHNVLEGTNQSGNIIHYVRRGHKLSQEANEQIKAARNRKRR